MDILNLLGISVICFSFLFLFYYLLKNNFILSIIYFFAFIFRIILSFLQEKIQLFPYKWDEDTFYSNGLEFFKYLNNYTYNNPFSEINSISSYGSFLGILFYFFNDSQMIARLSNVILSTFIIILIYRFCIDVLFLNKKSSYLISSIVAFTPSYMIYSVLIMRDIIIWNLIVLIVYFTSYWLLKSKNKHLLFSLIFLIILIPLRKQYIILLFISYIFLFFLKLNRYNIFYKKVPFNIIKYFIITISLIITPVIISMLFENELARWGNDAIIEYFNNQLQWRIQGGSAYLIDLKYNSILDLFLALPLKFLHFTFGPFLWTSTSPFIILASIESLIGFISFSYIILNYKFIKTKNKYINDVVFYLLAFAIIGLLANSIIDSNYGTAMRHRMIYMPFIFIISTLTYQNKNQIKLLNF